MCRTMLKLCSIASLFLNYIMAGHAFVVAKEDFIMETVVFWHCDNGKMTKNNSFGVNSAMIIIIGTMWLILITKTEICWTVQLSH